MPVVFKCSLLSKAGYDGVSTMILAGHPNLKLHNQNDNFTFIDHAVNHYKYIVTKCTKDYKSSSKADANYAWANT